MASNDLMVDGLLERLAAGFAEHADPARAIGAKAYMRNHFDFYGIGAPMQAAIAREALSGSPKPSEEQLGRIADECWARDEREWQYFACGYLRKHIRVASPSFIDVAERLITSKSWWDTIDSLASRTVGPLVTTHPELVNTMDAWIGSDNMWLARTAILHQLTYKERTDADRLFMYCEQRASDKEFFIRKSIGWSLREYSKTDEKAVRRFVAQHEHQLSGLSRTEALKWLARRGR